MVRYTLKDTSEATQELGWISIYAFLPDLDRKVLVWYNGDYMIAKRVYDAKQPALCWQDSEKRLYQWGSTETYWKPLPKPPGVS